MTTEERIRAMAELPCPSIGKFATCAPGGHAGTSPCDGYDPRTAALRSTTHRWTETGVCVYCGWSGGGQQPDTCLRDDADALLLVTREVGITVRFFWHPKVSNVEWSRSALQYPNPVHYGHGDTDAAALAAALYEALGLPDA